MTLDKDKIDDAALALLYLTVPPFVEWALAHATWDGLNRKACAPDGACWAFVKANGRSMPNRPGP